LQYGDEICSYAHRLSPKRDRKDATRPRHIASVAVIEFSKNTRLLAP